MPRFKDQAICIRLVDWSETSQIVALLCEKHGKVSGLAKGSKRTSPSSIARYSGGIELLTLGQVVGVIKSTGELATLTEWDLQESHWHLRKNLRAQQLGLYAAELATAMLPDQDPHPACFAALKSLLANLANPNYRELAILQYQWQLLTDCGYRPQLDVDVRSNQPLSAESDSPQSADTTNLNSDSSKPFFYVFDPHAGGLTVENKRLDHNAWRVRTATVEFLRQLESTPSPPAYPDTKINLPADPATIDRANQLLCVYVRTILDRQLHTMPFILRGDLKNPSEG